jgi:ribosomal protein S18 acetylase RimI-like enzyme
MAHDQDVELEVVDLSSLEPAALDPLWQWELGLWRDRLLWDAEATVAAFRRLAAQRRLPGKALRRGGRVLGCVVYLIAERLGAIAALTVAPDHNAMAVGEPLLRAAIDDLRQRDVARIESAFVSFDGEWLAAAFARQDLRSDWRDVLRLELDRWQGEAEPSLRGQLEPWRATDLNQAAAIMHAAYAGTVDAEMHARYRSPAGCRALLEQIVHQGSSGQPLAEASAVVRRRGHAVGFIVVTEISPGHAHLAQVAVHPDEQRQGLGRALVAYSLWRLATRRFRTLSLIVSRANRRALALYHGLGFRSVLAFPVGAWER